MVQATINYKSVFGNVQQKTEDLFRNLFYEEGGGGILLDPSFKWARVYIF